MLVLAIHEVVALAEVVQEVAAAAAQAVAPLIEVAIGLEAAPLVPVVL